MNMSDLNQAPNNSNTKKRKEDFEFVPVGPNGKEELGKGSYGCVKLARDKSTGQLYAIKIMTKKSIFEYSSRENLKREINIQRSIDHPHIIKLHHCFEDPENVYLVLEYAEQGSLFNYLRKKKKFPEEEAFIYFFQTCLGIDYLHKKKIIHRDLKPENLLLDDECNIKLCDFGWSAEDSKKRSTFCGTIDYMAPEMIKNQPHDHRLDIWCLGILLYEMLHGFAPFKGKNDKEKCSNIAKFTNITFSPSISPEAVDLIQKILKPAPVNRISMEQIFKHPWMKKYEKYYNTSLETYIVQVDDDEATTKGSATSNNPPSQVSSVGNNTTAKIMYITDNTSPIRVKEKNSEYSTDATSNGSRPYTSQNNYNQSNNTDQRKELKIAQPQTYNNKKPQSQQTKKPPYVQEVQPNYGQIDYSKSIDIPEYVQPKGGVPYNYGGTPKYDYVQPTNYQRYQQQQYQKQQQQQQPKQKYATSSNMDGDYDQDINEYLNKKMKKQQSYQYQEDDSNEYSTSNRNFLKEVSTRKMDRSNSQDTYNREFNKSNNKSKSQNRYPKTQIKTPRIVEDEDEEEYTEKRMSIISKRNKPSKDDSESTDSGEENEIGFFDRFLIKFGCLTRNTNKK